MPRAGTNIDSIARASRIRSITQRTVRGGAKGQELAEKAFHNGTENRDSQITVSSVTRPKFIFGVHIVDASGKYWIP